MADKDKLTYWERRAVWLEQQQHDSGDKHIDALIRAYMQAQQYLIAQAQQIYTRYLDKSELSETEVTRILNTTVTPDQLAELSQLVRATKDKVAKKQLQTYLDGLAVKHRITRIELLRAKSYVVAKQLANVQLKESEPYYIEAMQDAYNHAAAESIIGQTQKDFKVYQGDVIPKIDHQREQIRFVDPKTDKVLHKVDVVPDKPLTVFKEMSTKYAKQALGAAWKGENYSQRIWNNTDDLTKRLRELFTAKQLSGMSERTMTEALTKEFSVSAYQARRLVRTESAYFSNQARLHAWEQHGVEEYSLLAVLDFRTSKICRRMDGKVFKVTDARVDGEDGTYPPFHPFCRTVAVAHFTNSKYGGYRTARDPIANKAIKIPKDATYRDWERLLLHKHGKNDVQAMQNKVSHYSADLEQYRRYQDILGVKNVPKSFDDFQSMKYNDGETYQDLMSTAREATWERNALDNLEITTAHKMPNTNAPSSVVDIYKDDKLYQRRYYGVTGKPRLDIDFTDGGQPKYHPLVPHAHPWTTRKLENGDVKNERGHPYRPLTLAERIVNIDENPKTSR
ncbi:hypothetical protein [Lactobacillus brevis] [Lactiplantibacillus mudanjiangensis]|uniref:minor capsid protein n=1 Tax=Lactiplantibacillus mudanjiangensis TaxID=1296538 RepID=UPI00101535D6|nr:hypothetical protein [Lactobacillus brevis] [Lactiplantibacillus mudanjiangensis]